MNYDVSKNALSVRGLVFEGNKEIPVDLDFSLPDYCPDIQRILKCRVCPNITSKNISGDRLNIEGVSKIRVIYVDSENKKTRCCENAIPFSCSIDIRSTPENAFAVTALKVDYVNCRAVSPRKLDIHGAISICAKIYKKENLEISSNVNGNDIQQKISDMKLNSLAGIGQQQFSISEIIETEEGKPAESIINSDVYLVLKDYKNMAGKTVIKGEAILKILYISNISSGETEALNCSIPISQIIDVPGITEESRCIIDGAVLSHDEQVCTENDDNPGYISSEIKISAMVMAYSDKDISVVSDVYSTDYNLEVSKHPLKLNYLIDIFKENLNHKDNINLSDMNISKIIDSWSDNCNVNTTEENGKLVFKFKVTIGVLALDNEGIPIFIERIFEFNHSKSYENFSGCLECESEIIPLAVNCSISSSNSIEMNFEFEFSGEVYSCQKCNMVKDVTADESKAIEKDSACLTVYYASKDENIWDIARNYHTSASMVKEENDLSEDKIKSDCMLLIPMK